MTIVANPPHRLLIIDDEAAVGQSLVLMAESVGFEAKATVVIDQFMRELLYWQPTHLAIDLMMPGVDGVEVIRQLAERGCRLPIMIFSGMDSRVLASAQRAATERGLKIVGALQKPFSNSSLRQLLARVGGFAPKEKLPVRHVQAAEDDLRRALRLREFEVYYQPKIDCLTGIVTGFEALVRWRHPKAGLVMPDAFIVLAERYGLIHELTEEVLRQSFAWIAKSDPDLGWSLSVNLSPQSLTNRKLVDSLSELCSDHGLDPQRVILEVTETGAMDRPTEALDLLTRLRLRGFQIAIDDFGRGYSSMVQLVRMPFTELKIDRAFAMAATRTAESEAVLKSAVDLGHSLGLKVVAEGVDDDVTLRYLRDIGCDLAQGFLIAEAMTGDEVVPWMVQRVNSLHV